MGTHWCTDNPQIHVDYPMHFRRRWSCNHVAQECMCARPEKHETTVDLPCKDCLGIDAGHTHPCPTCHQARPCTGTGCADGPRECNTCSNCRGW